MKRTKEEIVEIAVGAMNDIGWTYDESREISPFFTSIDEQMDRADSAKDHPKYEEYIATLKDYWTVGFDFPLESGIAHNTMFLDLDDDTGKAYYLRHKQAGFKLQKNEKGEYDAIYDWVRGQGDH